MPLICNWFSLGYIDNIFLSGNNFDMHEIGP